MTVWITFARIGKKQELEKIMGAITVDSDQLGEEAKNLIEIHKNSILPDNYLKVTGVIWKFILKAYLIELQETVPFLESSQEKKQSPEDFLELGIYTEEIDTQCRLFRDIKTLFDKSLLAAQIEF